jgi:hypothetical protein
VSQLNTIYLAKKEEESGGRAKAAWLEIDAPLYAYLLQSISLALTGAC